MEDRSFHPLDYLSVVRRRKWWLIVPLVAALIAGAALAIYLPREYLSTTTVGVASPTVSPELAKSAPMDKDERVRAVSVQLLSRPVLERVVREEHLADGRGIDAALARLKQGIQTVRLPESIAPSDNGPRLDSFLISYLDRTPDEAQRVTARLAQVFVDETSRVRELRAQDTSEFLTSQMKAAEGRLSELEGKLRDAKKQNMGRLPEQTSANLQTLNGLRQQLEANGTALRSEQDRLSMIERQIEAMRQGVGMMPIVKGAEEPATGQARVTAIERELADARMTYTEKHPEIVRLQEELKASKADAAAERTRPASDRLASLQVDPTYRQLTADQEMGRLRVRDLQRAEAQTRQQIGDYQARVESAPLIEQQLASVQREYDLQKQQYGDVVSRRQAAGMAEDIERRGAGERFRVFSPANRPTTPYSPNPLRILLASLLAGICLGSVAAVGREFLDRSVHDAQTLQHEYEVPVLGEVSRIPAA